MVGVRGGKAGVLGLRYLPFLVAMTLLAALVAVAPTKQPDQKAGFDFSAGNTTVNAQGDVSDGAVASAAEPASGSDGSVAESSAAGGSPVPDGTPKAGVKQPGATATSAPAGGGTAASSEGVAVGNGVTKCEGVPAQPGWEAGMAPAPYPTGVPCLQFTGSNGGASMRGVTATEFRYTLWVPQSNAASNAVLAGAGLSLTPEQICAAGFNYQGTIQKRYQLYGRKLVPVDGKGSNSGSAQSNSCKYPYFQSQCSTTGAVDPACIRAEADTIASLGVAFVIAAGAGPVMISQLARHGVFVVGGDLFGLTSRAMQDQVAPYSWNPGLTYERAGQLWADFVCNQLAGRPPQYAGPGVREKSVRRTGLVYASAPGDDSTRTMAELYLSKVRACGDPGAKAYPYTPDTTRAQQDAINIVAQMQADGITNYMNLTEYITGIAILKQMDNNRYFPEIVMPPVLGLMNDFIGRIGNGISPTQYAHVFGLYEGALGSQPLDEWNAVWDDGGFGGSKSLAAAPAWPGFKMMGRLIHMAGPAPSERTIFDGGQAMPRALSTATTVGGAFGPPDRFAYQRDVTVGWWDANRTSEFDGGTGGYCYIDGAKRYDIGQFPKGEVALFANSGPCATTKP